MSENIRPAVEVWDDAIAAWAADTIDTRQAAAAVIEADREAVRAEVAAEVADYLKEGETIAECIARNRADANVLLEMFAAERVKVENYAKTMKIISDIANREAAELAKFKALADALASDIRNALSCTPIVRDGKIIYDCGNPWEILSAALRQYKEARDDKEMA